MLPVRHSRTHVPPSAIRRIFILNASFVRYWRVPGSPGTKREVSWAEHVGPSISCPQASEFIRCKIHRLRQITQPQHGEVRPRFLASIGVARLRTRACSIFNFVQLLCGERFLVSISTSSSSPRYASTLRRLAKWSSLLTVLPWRELLARPSWCRRSRVPMLSIRRGSVLCAALAAGLACSQGSAVEPSGAGSSATGPGTGSGGDSTGTIATTGTAGTTDSTGSAGGSGGTGGGGAGGTGGSGTFPMGTPTVQDFHLTARPWNPLNFPKDRYLTNLDKAVHAVAKWQDPTSGAIIDPNYKREYQYGTPFF